MVTPITEMPSHWILSEMAIYQQLSANIGITAGAS